MYSIVQEWVFFIKNLHETRSAAKYMDDAIFKIPTPLMLSKIVDMDNIYAMMQLHATDTKGISMNMHYWFSFFQILDEQAPQVAPENINLKILSELNATVPNQDEQMQLVAFVAQVDKSKPSKRKPR